MKLTLKKISAVFILVSFFLPLAQCQVFTEKNTELTQETVKELHVKEANNSGRQINVAKSFNSKNIGSWLALLTFLWPLLFVLLQAVAINRMLKAIIIVSPILCAITIYYISQVFLIGRPLYGGYIWLVGMGTFTLICLIELVQLIKRKSNTALQPTPKSGAAEL